MLLQWHADVCEVANCWPSQIHGNPATTLIQRSGCGTSGAEGILYVKPGRTTCRNVCWHTYKGIIKRRLIDLSM
jgi:hypothetical protein